MFFYEGYICPVCGEKFKETDDIVACPECGAPHHRECWKKEGHCHFQDTHGTSRQWKRPEPVSAPPSSPGPAPSGQGGAPSSASGRPCPNCGQINSEFAEFCSRCGRELPASDWSSAPRRQPPYPPPYQPPYGGQGQYGEYSPFHMPTIDPFGGVPRDETIDGVPAEDMVAVTGTNSAYYLPRFYKMSKGGSKCGWNWPAFLLTPYWLLYRKSYVAGAVVLFLSMMRTLLNAFIVNRLILPAVQGAETYADLYRMLANAMSTGEISVYIVWSLALLWLFDILIRVFFGVSGNYWYMRTCSSRVRRLRAKRPDLYAQELTAAGGTSFLMGASAYAILYFASMLISAFFL